MDDIKILLHVAYPKSYNTGDKYISLSVSDLSDDNINTALSCFKEGILKVEKERLYILNAIKGEPNEANN